MYIKKENNKTIEYFGPSLGRTIMTSNGWIWYEGTESVDRLSIQNDASVTITPEVVDTHDWRDTGDVINAAYALIDATQIAGVMQDAHKLKDAVAGLALLTSSAAPDGMIDLNDERVAHWLGLAGVTLEQLKSQLTIGGE